MGKGPTLSELKGQDAERRCLQIGRSLKPVLPIKEVKYAGKELDRVGVDIIFLLDLNGVQKKIPAQVKSSSSGVRKFRKKYPRYEARYGVIIIIVNSDRDDDEIRTEIQERIEHIIDTDHCFEIFFEHLSTGEAYQRSHPENKAQEVVRTVSKWRENTLDWYLQKNVGFSLEEVISLR